MHYIDYVFAHGADPVGDDGDILALADVFDDAVDQERLGEKTEHGEQPRLYIENEEGRRGDERIGDEQRPADVNGSEFFEYERHYIGAAGRGAAVEDYGAAHAREQNGECKLQKWLVGEGSRKADKLFEREVFERVDRAAINCFKGAALAEEDKAENEHQCVDDH